MAIPWIFVVACWTGPGVTFEQHDVYIGPAPGVCASYVAEEYACENSGGCTDIIILVGDCDGDADVDLADAAELQRLIGQPRLEDF